MNQHIALKYYESSIRVDCAAIMDEEGTIHSVPRPGRHHDVIRYMVQMGCKKPVTGPQGFLLTNGVFVERRAGKIIARLADQLLPGASPSRDLFSEDMW